MNCMSCQRALPETVEGGKLGEQHADSSHDGYELSQSNLGSSQQIVHSLQNSTHCTHIWR